jgi:hypothetical protein
MKIGKGARMTLRVVFNLLKRGHTEPPFIISFEPKIAQIGDGC